MSALSVFGIMLLCLAGIVLICLADRWLGRNFPTKEFDERQVQNRGRAYQLVFVVGIIYLIAMLPVLVGQVDGEKTVEPYLLVFGGLMVQELTFHVYCLMTDSALPLSGKKPVGLLLSYLFTGVLWFALFRRDQERWPLSPVGYGSGGFLYLMLSFNQFALALMHLIQLLRREKE